LDELRKFLNDHHCTFVLTSVALLLRANVTISLLLSSGKIFKDVKLASRTAQCEANAMQQKQTKQVARLQQSKKGKRTVGNQIADGHS
jgi:hypothetical protein